MQGGEGEGGVELFLSVPVVEPLALDERLLCSNVRERHEVLACAGMLQGRLLLVIRAEDHLAVVRREAAAAAAPHLRGQDPRDVGPRGLRRPCCLDPVVLREGEALLVV